MLPDDNLPHDVVRRTGHTTDELGQYEIPGDYVERPVQHDLGSLHIEGNRITVRIVVKDSVTPVVLVINQHATIGRYDPIIEDSPDLDLTAFGGYQMGISRRHAMLSVQRNRLIITDLGSRNGTFVNGIRLAPHDPMPIRHGDDIRMGKITLKIYLQ